MTPIIPSTVAAVITRDGVRRTRPPACDDADMHAMTVVPGQKGTAGVEEVPDPGAQDAALLVRGMALGVCGTDHEIAEGAYGTPPSGEERLIIGHESLGEVLEAPAGSGFAPGDLVIGIVRRPDPVLRGLITRRVPLTSWTDALDRHPEDIKVVVDLTA